MKKIVIGIIVLVIAILVFVLLGQGPKVEKVQSLGTQSQEASGVSIAVTPYVLLVGYDGTWDFEMVFDTHSGSLDQDIEKISVLVGNGKSYSPAAWVGDPPGGHHRKGNLRFNSVPPLTGLVELRIGGVSSDHEIIFEWTL